MLWIWTKIYMKETSCSKRCLNWLYTIFTKISYSPTLLQISTEPCCTSTRTHFLCNKLIFKRSHVHLSTWARNSFRFRWRPKFHTQKNTMMNHPTIINALRKSQRAERKVKKWKCHSAVWLIIEWDRFMYHISTFRLREWNEEVWSNAKHLYQSFTMEHE